MPSNTAAGPRTTRAVESDELNTKEIRTVNSKCRVFGVLGTI